MWQSRLCSADRAHGVPLIVTICTNGSGLTASFHNPESSCLSPVLISTWKAHGIILCTDFASLGGGDGRAVDVDVVVGVDDGAVLVLRICTHKCMVVGCSKLSQLSGPVTTVRVCSTGVAFASSGAEDCALFYYDWDTTHKRTSNVVRAIVQIPIAYSRPKSPVRVTCSLAVGREAPLHRVCAALGANCRNSCVLLVGCSDGAVHSVPVPDGEAVRRVARMPTIETDSTPLKVRASVLERFGTGIVALHEGIMPGTESYPTSATALWALQEDGVCHVVGVKPRLSGALAQCLYQLLLPAEADLSTVQLLKEVVLFISTDTGALCACYISDSGTNTGYDSGISATSLTTVQITPTHGSYLDGFAVVVQGPMCTSGLAVKSSEPLQSHILLHNCAASGTVVRPFTLPPTACNHEDNQLTSGALVIVQALQRACGHDGSGGAHPRHFVPTAVVLASSPISEASTVIEEAPRRDTDQDAQVESLGAQLTSTLKSHAHLQEGLEVPDCELLQLTALLNVLGDERDGLQLHSGTPCDGTQSEAGALGCWSDPLRNWNGTLVLRFRFRCDPLSAPDCGHGILLDVELSANTLTAMRALHGRTVLVSLSDAAPPTSLHPNAHTSATVLQFQPVGLPHGGRDSGEQFQARFTSSVTSLSRLCAYRLALCVAVDGPEMSFCEAATAVNPDAGTLLGLVDELLPLQAMLAVIVCSPEFAATEGLQRIIHSESSSGTAVPNSTAAAGSPEQYELRCAGRDRGGAAVASQSPVERWIETVQTCHNATASTDSLSANPLRAAFLLPAQQTRGPVAANAASIDLHLKQGTGKKGGVDSEVVVGTRRAMLTAVSAEVDEASTAPTCTDSKCARTAPSPTDRHQLPPELHEIAAQARSLAWRCDPAVAQQDGVSWERGGAARAEDEAMWRLYQKLRDLT